MYLPSRLHVCKPSTLGIDGHVGEHGGDRLVMNVVWLISPYLDKLLVTDDTYLVIDDGGAEGFPLVRILRCLVKGSLADTSCTLRV